MTTTEIVAIIVVVLIAAALVAWYFLRQERTKKLRGQFGPEYDQAVRQLGDRAKAEEDLLGRRKRVEKFPIRRLPEQERERFADLWHRAQTGFVDDPAGSIRETDRLVCELMEARGYPVADFEQRAEDLSVDHPLVVRHYRAAHAIATRLEEERTGMIDAAAVDTEDLRQGLVYYRELFDELLEAHAVAPRGVGR